MNVAAYVKTFWWDRGLNPMAKVLRAMIRDLMEIGPPEPQVSVRVPDQARVRREQVHHAC